MNDLVRLFTNDDGTIIDEHLWHLSLEYIGYSVTLCDHKAYGTGYRPAEYEIKTVKRGGVTCQECLDTIKEIKAVKL